MVFGLVLTFLLPQFIVKVPETLRLWVRNAKYYPIVLLLPKEAAALRGKPAVVLSASPMLFSPQTASQAPRHNILASEVYVNQVKGKDRQTPGQTYTQTLPAPTSGL